MKKRVNNKQKRNIKINSQNKLTNKKINLNPILITLGILIIILLGITLIKNYTGKVIDTENFDDPLGIGLNPEDIPQTPEEATTVGKDYLTKEWISIINNTDHPVGKVLWAAHRGLTKISPAFKILMGIDYTLSWLFLLTLIIWITLVTFLYRIFSIYSTFSKGVSFVVSLCMIVIASTLRVPLIIANKIIAAINLLTSWQMRLALVIALIIGLILISSFSKQWAGIMKKWKENRKKLKMEEAIDELKAQGKSQTEIQKIIMDTFGEIGDGLKD